MPAEASQQVVRHLRRVVLRGEGDGISDGQLLGQYLADRDESAFEALVHRHGGMVLGVCRRILRHGQDADDAFQATFLVLVRRADTIVPLELVGHWLYGVALRTALKARALSAKRLEKERQGAAMARSEATAPKACPDAEAVLDEEIDRLPAKFQTPLVLCYMEGRSKPEIAQRLGLSEGTVSSRLARARELLRKRLAGRGLAISAVSLTAMLSQSTASAAVSMPLLQTTVQAAMSLTGGSIVASAAVSAEVAAITQGVLKAMFLAKLKSASSIAVALILFLSGAGVVTQHLLAAGDKPQAKADAVAKEDKPKGEKKDGQGKANGPVVTIDSVDVEKGTITVKKGEGRTKTINVSKDVTITVDGKAAKLADLKQGTAVRVGLMFVDKETPPTIISITAGPDIREEPATPKPQGEKTPQAPKPQNPQPEKTPKP